MLVEPCTASREILFFKNIIHRIFYYYYFFILFPARITRIPRSRKFIDYFHRFIFTFVSLFKSTFFFLSKCNDARRATICLDVRYFFFYYIKSYFFLFFCFRIELFLCFFFHLLVTNWIFIYCAHRTSRVAFLFIFFSNRSVYYYSIISFAVEKKNNILHRNSTWKICAAKVCVKRVSLMPADVLNTSISDVID